MRSYVYWPNMDKDIENVIKSCKGCALAAKAPPIKYSPLPKISEKDQQTSDIFSLCDKVLLNSE